MLREAQVFNAVKERPQIRSRDPIFIDRNRFAIGYLLFYRDLPYLPSRADEGETGSVYNRSFS